MKRAGNESLLRVLTVTVGIVLALLLLENFLPSSMADIHPLPRLFNLVMIIVLTLSLVSLRLIRRKQSIGSLVDMTKEMSEMQREMDKSAWRYKCLLEGAGNAIFVFNVENGVLEEVNRKATELLGYTREEMMAMNGKDIIAEEEHDNFSSLVMRLLRRGRVRSDGLKFKRKNGGHFFGEIDARLIDLGDTRVVHVIVRDITFKRRAEREIRQRNQELSILMNFMARVNQSLELHTVLDVTLRETIEVLGADGGLIHLMGEGGEHLTLAATHQISGSLKTGMQKCSFSAGTPCFIVETSHSHSIDKLDESPCSIGTLAAAEGWLSSAAAPLLAQNRLIGIMHILSRTKRRFSDEEMTLFSTIGSQIGIVIEHARLFEELNLKTEELLRSYRLLEKSSHQLAISQRKLNKNLVLFEHANHELGRLDTMKNHFLGMISHEFRTPLTGIMSGTEFLLHSLEGISEDERQILHMIYNGGTRLNEIISDLLRVVRLESRTVAVNRTVLHMQDIMELMQEQFEPMLRERCQRFRFLGLDDLPYFNGDRGYLEEVFIKLLENAIKFSRDGDEIVIAGTVADRNTLQHKEEILLSFNRVFVEQMGESCYLQVEIRDSGIGIETVESVKIFEKFYEVGEIRHHSTGKHKFQGKGAGLGLAIVKGMVEAHGGMVWVESPSCSGRGSSFFILLPLEEGLKQPAFPFMQAESSVSEELLIP